MHELRSSTPYACMQNLWARTSAWERCLLATEAGDEFAKSIMTAQEVEMNLRSCFGEKIVDWLDERLSLNFDRTLLYGVEI